MKPLDKPTSAEAYATLVAMFGREAVPDVLADIKASLPPLDERQAGLRRRTPMEEAAWHEGYAFGVKMAARSQPDVEALNWLIDNSVPTHSSECAVQDDEQPCFCGVSDRYAEVLALSRLDPPTCAFCRDYLDDTSVSYHAICDPAAAPVPAQEERLDVELREAAQAVYDRLAKLAHGADMREDIEALGRALGVETQDEGEPVPEVQS